jgi:hypothetical protein
VVSSCEGSRLNGEISVCRNLPGRAAARETADRALHEALLAHARDLLHERAARIGDLAFRHAFLRNVAAHREIERERERERL